MKISQAIVFNGDIIKETIKELKAELRLTSDEKLRERIEIGIFILENNLKESTPLEPIIRDAYNAGTMIHEPFVVDTVDDYLNETEI